MDPGSAKSAVRDDGANFIMGKHPCVYIMTNRPRGTLYVGVTSSLMKRVWEHRNDVVEGFTSEYGLKQLVWYEVHDNMESAIKREKSLKRWKRIWKIEMVENKNPAWKDLFEEIAY